MAFQMISARGLAAGLAALLMTAPAAFAEIAVSDGYMRVSRPGAPSGAAFMTISNSGDTPDRLLAASAAFADRVELHTHSESADGVMSMHEVPEGFEIPANGRHELARGGDHVMFMGLQGAVEPGSTVQVTLHFEIAGDVAIELSVESPAAAERPGHGHGHGGGHAGH